MAGTLRTFLRSDHAIVKPEGGEGSVSFIVERRKAERAVNGVLEAHNALSGNSGHARVTNRNISSGVAAALKRLIDSGYLREKGVVLRRGAGGQPPVLMHNQESLLQILKAVDQALTARALMPTEKKRILAELEDPRRLASTGYLLRPRTKRQRS